MRGHESVLKMRLEGFKPESVWIWDGDGYVGSHGHLEDLKRPQISTAGDDVASLDLRFVVGCQVFVNADSSKRGKQIAALCQKADASQVIVFAENRAAIWKRGGKWLSI